MAEGSRLCPYCRRLNSVGEKQCYHCGKRLPGAIGSSLLDVGRDLSAGEAPAAKAILGLCLAVFALCAATEPRIPPLLSDGFMNSTVLRFGAFGSRIGHLEPWRYLSAVFVHANALHIVMNGLSLASLAGSAEVDFGWARFVVLFLLTGVLGFVVSDLYGLNSLTVGASGAVFGVMGGAIGERLAARDPRWKDMLVRAVIYALIMVFVPIPINNAAHFGGLFSGFALGFLLNRIGRRFDGVLSALAILGVVAALVSIGLSAHSDFWRLMRVAEIQEGSWPPK